MRGPCLLFKVELELSFRPLLVDYIDMFLPVLESVLFIYICFTKSSILCNFQTDIPYFRNPFHIYMFPLSYKLNFYLLIASCFLWADSVVKYWNPLSRTSLFTTVSFHLLFIDSKLLIEV